MKKFKSKDMEKQLGISIKNHAKEFGYKKVEFYSFKKYKDYFITIGFNEVNPEIWGDAEIKPYFIDDVFWDVFDMSSNKDQPMSLRARGAFVLGGISIVDLKFPVHQSLDEIDEIVQEIFKEADEKCIKFIDELGDDVDNFVNIAEKSDGGYGFDIKLIKMLYHIKNNSFEKALMLAKEEISKGNRGCFCSSTKDIYEYVADYCNERLSD